MPEIIVTIKRKSPKSQVHSPKTGKALLPVRGAKKPLKRRLGKETFIRFFDLGRLADGSGVEFVINPSVTVSGGSEPEIRNLELSDFTALENEIFSRELSEYYRITTAEGDLYRINVIGEDPEAESFEENTLSGNADWTAKGLFLTNEQLGFADIRIKGISSEVSNGADVVYDVYFNDLNLKGEFKNKITDERDYDADEVLFDLAQKADIYLMPALVTVKLQAQKTGLIGEPDSGYLYVGGLNYLLAPRDVENEIKPRFFEETSADTAEFEDRANFAKLLSSQKMYKVLDTSTTAVSLSEFPPPDRTMGTSYVIFDRDFSGDGYITKRLLAVIKQNGQTFYIWERD